MMLLAAGLMEVGWVYLMKLTEGFTRLWPSVAFLRSPLRPSICCRQR
ncbi:DMT family transporter [Hankyongella ginsenosidimutans]|nr:SMR family transporter [Hankyongella ginsenosidimutans]